MKLKRHFYYPFIIFSVPLYAATICLYSALCFVKVSVRIIENLLGRAEWWLCDCHKDRSQPLNPFNETFKDIWKEEFGEIK